MVGAVPAEGKYRVDKSFGVAWLAYPMGGADSEPLSSIVESVEDGESMGHSVLRRRKAAPE